MTEPQPSVLEHLQSWIGAVVAAGTGIYAIWKGMRFSATKIREVYSTIIRFGDALEAVNDLRRRTSEIAATQQVYSAISKQPIWRSNPQGYCVEANAALLSLIGITFDDIKGSGWSAYIHPDDYERVWREWNEAITSRSRFKSQFRFLRPDGASVAVDSRAFPVVNESGEVIGYVGTDITTH